MSQKGIMLNDRPADKGVVHNVVGSFAADAAAAANYQLHNYKGVMLCNRPPDYGIVKKQEPSGGYQFVNRVNPQVPLGWNPSMKKMARKNRKKFNPDGVLARHRMFLRNLENKKNDERN